jgi:Protein of unknown function (DUF2946)
LAAIINSRPLLQPLLPIIPQFGMGHANTPCHNAPPTQLASVTINPMEPWALNAMQRWPNVPALFGWLSLDRRGRWLIKDEVITRPQIIDTINANYDVDEHGRWFFQNGPQRGFMQLAYAPLVVRVESDTLITHTEQPVEQLKQIYLDEEGSLLLITEHGPAGLIDTDLEWAIERIHQQRNATTSTVSAEDITAALALPSGQLTELSFRWQQPLPITRLDKSAHQQQHKFERDPQPRAVERVATKVAD